MSESEPAFPGGVSAGSFAEATKRRILLSSFNALQSLFARFGWGFTSFRQAGRVEGMKVVRRVRMERDLRMTPLEANQLFMLVAATVKIGGAMAEVGVFRGASAQIIRCADRGVRPLHLFDTFEGLPETRADDTTHNMGAFRKGEMACSLEEVRQYLGTSRDLYFHQGLFQETASAVADSCFSFVHSDVDLYESTKAVLEFFYPRMLRGGIILTHDFAGAAGPNRAFRAFAADKTEPVIELAGDQAIIVKT